MINTVTCQDRTRSAELFESAQNLLPGGVNSPVRASKAVGGNPPFIQRAKGAYIFDVDGNRYLDLVGSWGPAIVGHAHPRVIQAVHDAADDGISFGACCAQEQELAAIIVEALPSVEMVRFVNSGTEATMSAIRLARATTGRDRILKFLGGYHGHADSLLVSAGSGAATFGVPDSAGVPRSFAETTLLAPYNNLESVTQVLNEHGDQVAAILVEPIAGNMGYVAPDEGFLSGLRNLCDQFSCLLVFDEVMTGFRVGWGGYQNVCGVTPDITCLGKVIGGGMPVAAYGGSKRIMSQLSPVGPVYQAGTLSGNPLGMAAGIETLTLCKQPGFYDDLANKSKMLTEGLSTAANRFGVPLQTGYCGGMVGVSFASKALRNFDDAAACDHEGFATFYRSMLDLGVWLPPSGYEAMFVSAAHDEKSISTILDAAEHAFKEMVS